MQLNIRNECSKKVTHAQEQNLDLDNCYKRDEKKLKGGFF